MSRRYMITCYTGAGTFWMSRGVEFLWVPSLFSKLSSCIRRRSMKHIQRKGRKQS